jgi:transposase, IS5 family
LLKVTGEVIQNAKLAVKHLKEETSERACALASELEGYVSLGEQVISQTKRRVLLGESVPASEKLVSIFEPHTDIIRKDRRAT